MRIGLTGISGSLGTALVKELAPSNIVVGVTRDELRAERILADDRTGNVRAMVVSEGIADREALCRAFDGCQAIIHAAALKRISQSVYTTEELIKTNVLGTMNVLHAAREVGAKKVLVVSSDKAVESTNLYGSTKFCAECLAVQENAFSWPKGMHTACVRYGNVLGSRGSVVHIWRDQVRRGIPLTITDTAMTRFIITMSHAVRVITDALDSMQGGEIFVPLLSAAKMTALAKAIKHEAGVPDAPVIEIGMRPGGEKLHESLLSQEEVGRVGMDSRTGLLVVMPSHRSWTQYPYNYDRYNAGSYTSEHADKLVADELVELLKGVSVRPVNE